MPNDWRCVLRICLLFGLRYVLIDWMCVLRICLLFGLRCVLIDWMCVLRMHFFVWVEMRAMGLDVHTAHHDKHTVAE